MTPEKLNSILKAHAKWLRNEEGGQRANLSGANLGSADLSEANLSGAYLSRAFLNGADLGSADLSKADLSGTLLRGADLIGANLTEANLRDANLRRANLTGAIGILGAEKNPRGHWFFAQDNGRGRYWLHYGCHRADTLDKALRHYGDAYAFKHGQECRDASVAILRRIANIVGRYDT